MYTAGATGHFFRSRRETDDPLLNLLHFFRAESMSETRRLRNRFQAPPARLPFAGTSRPPPEQLVLGLRRSKSDVCG